jgi:hypothetical protein
VVVVAAAPNARNGTMAVAVLPASPAESAAYGSGSSVASPEASPLLGGRLSWGAGGGGGDALEGTLTSLADGAASFPVRWVEAHAADAADAKAAAAPLVTARAAAQAALALVQAECAAAECAAAEAEAAELAACVGARAAKAQRVAAACGAPEPEAAALASGLAAALRAADDGAGLSGDGSGSLAAAAALRGLSSFAAAEEAYEHAL